MIVATPQRLSESASAQLIATLEEMVQVYSELLTRLQEEKRLIIEGKVDLLLRCVSQKKKLLDRVAHLEKERIQSLEGLNHSTSPLTLKALIPYVSTSDQEKLASLGSRLEGLTSSIEEINHVNGILIERVLGQISDLFALLRHLTSDGTTYQNTGKMNSLSSGKTFSRT